MLFRHLLRAGLLSVTTFLFISQAHADFVNHPLPDNAAALPGFHGTAHWSLSAAFPSGATRTLDLNVDYAVFAPGTYPRDLSNFTPYTNLEVFEAPNANDYLYAYQVYNNGSPNDPSADSLRFLSVGLQSDDFVHSLGRDLGFDPAGLDALTAVLGSDGAKYFMTLSGFGQPLAPNQFSTVFLLASPNAPGFESSYVVSSFGLSDEAVLPAPVPTPSAALAGLLGLLSLAAWKHFRK